MLLEDFVYNLNTKFKSKDDEENRIFASDLSNFASSVKPDSLQDIYNAITREHTYSTIPRMGKLWKIAENGGYLKQKKVEHNPVWFKCKCGATYSKEGRGCPKCRSTKAELVTGESVPDDLIHVHEDCYYCTIYKESVKRENERKLYGTSCGDYGIKQDPHCSACQCRECCRQMMQYNANPKQTTDDYRTTRLAQPWLIECPKLDDTAQAMLDVMTGRRNPAAKTLEPEEF